MSTATTTRPAGDNEFPVLLRLPDLNAPLWMPAPTALPTMVPAATIAPPAMPSLWSTPLEPLPATATAPAPTLTTSSIDVAAPVATGPAVAASTTATVSAPRAERTNRSERPTASQWTLIRQLATGGVLVGGLALTYFMIMGSGDDGTPSHVPTAESTLEPPVIETPTHVVAQNATDPSKSESPAGSKPEAKKNDGIAAVPPPPDFDPNPKSELPKHIVVSPPLEPKPSDNAAASGEGNAPSEKYHGRIGPGMTASAPPSPQYPTTDPSTFLYRVDGSAPDNEAARTAARLDGTIAPPPRR